MGEPITPPATPPDGYRDIAQIKDILPQAASKFEAEKNPPDQDDLITYEKLASLKNYATSDIDSLVKNGFLTPDAADQFRDQIDRLHAQDRQTPKTPENKG